MVVLKGFKTYELAVRLYKECEQLNARSHIKDQLLRASLSIMLNIAEGSAKPTIKDKRRYYAIALGSVRETQSLLSLLEAKNAFALSDQVGACCYRLVHGK